MELRRDATTATYVALLRAFLNDDVEAARVLLETNDARYLLGAGIKWHNDIGVTHFGRDALGDFDAEGFERGRREWDRLLVEYLREHAE